MSGLPLFRLGMMMYHGNQPPTNRLNRRHAGMDIGKLIPRHALYRPNHTAVVFAGERFT